MGGGGEGRPVGHLYPFPFSSYFSFSFRFSFKEGTIPRTLRTGHAGVGGFSCVAATVPGRSRFLTVVFCTGLSLRDEGPEKRDTNKQINTKGQEVMSI
jgi:hypothetical protein